RSTHFRGSRLNGVIDVIQFDAGFLSNSESFMSLPFAQTVRIGEPSGDSQTSQDDEVPSEADDFPPPIELARFLSERAQGRELDAPHGTRECPCEFAGC